MLKPMDPGCWMVSAWRRSRTVVGLLVAVMLAPTFAIADDGLVLLQRMAQASRQLTYSGVFVYQTGRRMESSRIAHVYQDGRDQERIEVLDGSPREIIRNGEEMRRFIPDENRLIIETHAAQRRFPALLPVGLARLPDYYQIRWQGYGRVAGLDSRVLVLDPRDGLRYGWQFWVDMNSGLLLRSRIVDDQGEQLESFSFTQVKIGDPLAANALQPGFDSRHARVQRITAMEITPESQGWSFRVTLPGFQRIIALKRETDDGRPPSLHVLFSDGVASISAFIEQQPASAKTAPSAPLLTNMGPLSVYHRQVHDHLLVVMGEVPPMAVKQLGDGVEWKGK